MNHSFSLRRLTAIIVRFTTRLLWRVQIEGLENVPNNGGFILVSNHVTYLDPLWFLLLVNRWYQAHSFVPAGASYMKNGSLLSGLLKMLGSVSVQNKVDLSSVRYIINKLARGYGIGIFPEGTRTKDGSLGKFKNGAFFIARKAGVPILPVAIIGAYEFYNHRRKLPKILKRNGWKFSRYKLTFKIEELIHVDDFNSQDDLNRYTRSTILDMLREI